MQIPTRQFAETQLRSMSSLQRELQDIQRRLTRIEQQLERIAGTGEDRQ